MYVYIYIHIYIYIYIIMSIENFPGNSSQAILLGIMLVGIRYNRDKV